MGVDMLISRVGQCVIFVCVPLRAEGKIKTSASSRTCHVLSNQTVKSDFTDILPWLQSPPAPPPVLRRSQLLVGSAHYLQNSNGIIRYLTVRISDTATAVHKLWCGLHCWNMLVFPTPVTVGSCQKLTISCSMYQEILHRMEILGPLCHCGVLHKMCVQSD